MITYLKVYFTIMLYLSTSHRLDSLGRSTCLILIEVNKYMIYDLIHYKKFNKKMFTIGLLDQ